MIRWVMFGNVLCFLIAASPAVLFAQFNPYGNGANPYAPGADPRVQRAYREQAVAAVGAKARDFVETYGNYAVAAIFACSRPVAVQLADFHLSGEMAKLPRPGDLLWVIAQPRHGDDVARFAIYHSRELSDVDSFNAYLISPLDYALGLKPLAAGAAEVRARRLNQAAMKTMPWTTLSAEQKMAIVGGVGFVVIAGILLWRRRQSGIC